MTELKEAIDLVRSEFIDTGSGYGCALVKVLDAAEQAEKLRALLQPSPQPDTVTVITDNTETLKNALARIAELEGKVNASNSDTVTISRESFERVREALEDIMNRNAIQHWFNTDKQRDALSLLNAEGKV
jgi:metal-dependent amidase/aminoacylase/carboxypeptidase family protein